MTQENYAGYVADFCLATLANGEKRRMDQLRKGDRIRSLQGKLATIDCVIETKLSGQCMDMVRLPGGLTVTPLHPVWENDSTAWDYPIDLYDDLLASKKPNSIFAFVLNSYHSMIINGVSVICWGHNFNSDELASHPYLGDHQALTDDLAKLPGWSEGHIKLRPGALLRDPTTNLVCGINPDFCISDE